MGAAFVVPLLAGIVSAAFAAMVWGQFSLRRRPHQLAWALGLSAYAVASFIEAYVTDAPWSVPLYRTYFPLAAATVGLLGLGTVLLARVNVWTALFAAMTGIGIVITLVGPFALALSDDTPVNLSDGTTTTLHDAGPALGARAVPLTPTNPNPGRIAFLVLNIVGGLALIGGALCLGAVLPFAGGSLQTLFDLDLRVALQLAGIVVMFVGFLQGREVPTRQAIASTDS
jgi:hypothetical protein